MTFDVQGRPSYARREFQGYAANMRSRKPGTFRIVRMLAIIPGMLIFMVLNSMVYAATTKLVAFGDSLTAGYLLPQDASFASQLEKALRLNGHDVEVIQGGVSGDTTADGLARLDWTVPADAKGVIVELGANDAFRGVAPEVVKTNLDSIIAKLKSRGMSVFLAGMYAPRNMGEDYVKRFDANYAELASKHGVALYPFFLDGVAGNAKLNLSDGVHPTREGVAIIVQRILPAVEAWVGSLK